MNGVYENKVGSGYVKIDGLYCYMSDSPGRSFRHSFDLWLAEGWIVKVDLTWEEALLIENL